MVALPFPPDDLTAPQSTVASEIRAARGGRLPDLYRMLLHAPDVAHSWLGLGTAIRYRTSLADDVRETLICFVAEVQRCPSEVATHRPLAEAAGVPRSVLVDLVQWRGLPSLSADLARALAVAEPAVASDAPDQEALDGAVEAFGIQGTAEIFALVGYYSAIAIFLNATGLSPASPR